MQNAGSLVVLGSINADHILNLQSFPTPGETVTGNHYQVAFGGKGANQAVAAGRSGANIAFIACTGDDSIGESVRQQLATDNIDITPVSVIKGESTGVALIFVNGEGENVIGIHAGANAALSPALVEAQRERIANASALLMQLESPLESVMAAAKIAHQNKTIVALNPAPARELPDELLALVDIITPNETEAEKLTGIRVENDEDAAKAAQVLHEKGIRTVLITLGSRGVWASVNGEGQRDAILIPQQGVSRTPRGDATVLIVNDKSQVEARPVVASQAIGDKWLISEGLKSGDQVIVSGLQKARPGEQVKATTDTPADTASK